MRAGSLRKRVTFEEVNEGAVGDRGERLAAWRAVSGGSCVPCALLPRRGGEREDFGGLTEYQEFDLITRSNSVTRAITPAHRATVDGVLFNIQSVTNPDQRNRKLVFRVVEGEAD